MLPSVWQALIIVCLVLGIFFRFVQLDSKVYQYDETFTALRVSGYTEAEVVEALTEARLVSVSDIQDFQRLNTEKRGVDTLKGLVREEPQLTPLFFALERLWVRWFETWGNGIVVTRSLSAILSLLAFPALGWLCWELFQSPSVAWLAVALYAVSPFHVLYAQEARPIEAWAVAVLAMGATLLWAIRRRSELSWLLYALSVAVSLYTFLFSSFVVMAQLAYVATLEQLQRQRIVVAHLAAVALGVIMFSPWFLKLLLNTQQVQEVTNWTNQGGPSLFTYGITWMHNLSLGFVDGNLSSATPLVLKLALRLIEVATVALIVYSFYFIWSKEKLNRWLFVVALAGVPALCLIIPDLVTNGIRSIIPRYAVPCYLGSQISVAYLLTNKLNDVARQRFWSIVTVLVLSGGVLSCAAISQADTWWNKMIGSANPALAQQINQADRPLLISDADMGDLFSLSYYLDPKVQLLVRPQCYACNLNRTLENRPYLPTIPKGFSDVFVFHPRPSLGWMEALKQSPYPLQVVSEGHDRWLWRVQR
ncbi:hypothetical protein IFO70_09450 [Phormidium tenue FACHB-886]|nr:hypothetical protein [Phormidium tenue FACHB-886]